MKKVLFVRKFENDSDLKDKKSLIVVFKKKGTLYVKNIDFDPKDRFKINYDESSNEVVIRCRINDDEYLSIGDDKGLVDTRIINPKP